MPRTVARSCKRPADEDERITYIQPIAEALGISSRWVSKALNDELRYSKVSAKWIPHILTQENKRQRAGCMFKISPPNLRTTVTEGVSVKPLLVTKHGCATTWPERKAQQYRTWVPKGGNPPPIAERNRSTMRVAPISVWTRLRMREKEREREGGEERRGEEKKERERESYRLFSLYDPEID